MSYIFPINWPLKLPTQKGEKPKPQNPFKQRCIVVKVKHDSKGPQLKVDFDNGSGTVELPKELCKKENGKLVPDESKAPHLFETIRKWAATVTNPELCE